MYKDYKRQRVTKTDTQIIIVVTFHEGDYDPGKPELDWDGTVLNAAPYIRTAELSIETFIIKDTPAPDDKQIKAYLNSKLAQRHAGRDPIPEQENV